MNAKILIVLGMVAVVAADKRPFSYGPPQPQPTYRQPEPQPTYRQPEPRPTYRQASSEEFEAPKYGFDWDVEDQYTGNDFQHQENREDDNTQGSYSVQLPDGRLQTVTYYIDGDSGYVAEVSYQGEAQYPEESRESREYGYGK